MASDTESTLWSEPWMQSGEGSGSGSSWGTAGGGVAVGEGEATEEGSGEGAVLPGATACEGPRLSVTGLRQLGKNAARERRTKVARRRFTLSFITSNRRRRHCPSRTAAHRFAFAERRARSSIGSRRPFSERAISVVSRLRRVSSFFALITNQVAMRRYPGGCDWKKAQACALARNRRSSAPLSLTFARSND